MIYLDYSATTMPNEEVLNSFIKCSKDYVGNPNSIHKLGTNLRSIIDQASNQIADLLKIKPSEIIYTSGASESNNLALKGSILNYQNRGKTIITTKLEHSSINETLSFLEIKGYNVKYVDLDNSGRVNLNNLKEILDEDVVLVTICAVNSELGILQPINEIGKILKDYPKCIFHSDMTQAIGKINIEISNVDLVSFSAHKFFGINGIGALIKKENIELTPLIHGGKSVTKYRSGTPSLPLIVSLAKALRLSLIDLNNKYNKVNDLNIYLKNKLLKYEKVSINSNDYSIPHILNISIDGIKPETFIHALEEYDIYISTKSACSDNKLISESVYAITNDINKAKTSLRISISYVTTKEEIDKFIECFDICYNKLTNLR